MSEPSKTSSGRETRRPGENTQKKSALQKLREARSSGIKRTEQYEVQDQKAVFEELDADEYERRQENRANDDFIVDDEGYGYKDQGGEIWEVSEAADKDPKKKKRQKIAKDGQGIDQFMLPVSAMQRQKKPLISAAKQAVKVDAAESKEVLNSLFDDLDQKDAEELEEQNRMVTKNNEQVLGEGGQIALNRDEEMAFKAAAMASETRNTKTGPSANPFAKKKESQAMVSEEPMQIEEDFPSATASDIKMESAAATSSAEVSAPSKPLVESSPSQPMRPSNTEDDWKRLKATNEQLNNQNKFVDTSQQLQSQDLPLALNKDGTLSFYWFDAHEELKGQAVYLFGKVWQPEVNQYVSCSLKIDGLERTMYALPKVKGKSRGALTADEENKLLTNVFTELEELRKRRFKDITQLKCKAVHRKYAFETPLEHGEHKLLKVKYPASMPPLPENLTGNTFDAIFGSQTSMLETFILKQKIKGPCWLTLKNPTQIKGGQYRSSWCKQEIQVSSPKDAFCSVDDLNKASPPMTAFCFSTKLTRSKHNTNEIAMISCITHRNLNQDGPTKDNQFQSFTLIRKLDQQPLPFDLQAKLRNRKDSNIHVFQTERQMLEMFINKLHIIDPDLLVSHNLCGSVIEVILARISYLKIAHWSRIGRMRRSNMPQRNFGTSSMHSWVPRQVSCGRLLVDTFLNAKELVRETQYDLSYLSRTQLKKERRDFDDELLPKIYQQSETLFQLVNHTETDAYLIFQLMSHLQIIPLTKQLTTIAGNLWFRSLQNARAERNEWLLMHEFSSRKFLCPDKKSLNAKEAKKAQFGEDGEENETGGKKGGKKRGKAKYGGGLVLEPKAGFYDNIILLLDFNSLYPSIIQEYNLCFTTVNRRQTRNYDGSAIAKPKTFSVGADQSDDENLNDLMEGEELAELPEKTGTATKDAILPNVLRNLVMKRKQVKNMIKSERDPVKLGQLDIRQKALKLTANSIYGCLGFQSSRFYAQAIAALITRTGREILMKTKEIAEEKLGFSVVYGDTDSIMINSGTTNLKDAIEIGRRLKAEVNVLFKCLEIEIDGVFKSLLLLKKKKYAALQINNWGTPEQQIVKEVKGLDMVRRDWCNLSKDVGNKVLEEILSGKEREQIIVELNTFFTTLHDRMHNGNINIQKYVITKQLTQAPSAYQNFKALPHVIVANRLIQQGGKTESDLVGNFVGYVICEKVKPQAEEVKDGEKVAANHNKFSFEEAAYSFDELINSKGTLKIDLEWYKSSQLIPPIQRLIEHIDGVDLEFVESALGVLNKAKKTSGTTEGQEAAVPQAILKTETQSSLQQRSLARFSVKCPFCAHDFEIKGIYRTEKIGPKGQEQNVKVSGIQCEKCRETMPKQFLKNRVTLFLKQMIEFYYQGLMECQEPSCRNKTRQLSVRDRCVNSTCRGRLAGSQFTEKSTNDTMRYLQGLFNVSKYQRELKQQMQMEGTKADDSLVEEIINDKIFKELKSQVDLQLRKSSYNSVDLAQLFSFMTTHK